jgi:ADP-ribose pyrophosphatase YjhB (NUDIX family)
MTRKTYFVVTGLVMKDDKLLILKKGADDYNYPLHWSFCSGFIKEFEAGEDTVMREIKEETGLYAEIVKQGNIIKVEDIVKDKNWVVMVFLCKADSTEVKLDHENIDYKWIKKDELKNFKFVPGLLDNLKAVGLL